MHAISEDNNFVLKFEQVMIISYGLARQTCCYPSY